MNHDKDAADKILEQQNEIAKLKAKLERAKVALEFYSGDDKSDIDMDIFDKIKINTLDEKHPYVEWVDTEWLCEPAREALKELEK